MRKYSSVGYPELLNNTYDELSQLTNQTTHKLRLRSAVVKNELISMESILSMLASITGMAGKSGFGSASTAEDVTHGIGATNLTAIITGGTSGIGLETARVLAGRGGHVIIAARNMKAAKDAKQFILQENASARIDILQLDLCSIKSVKQFAHDFLSRHFLLTNLLLDKMKQTAKATGIEGRIVNLSSIAHIHTYNGGIRFHKINDKSSYSDKKAYGQSKLANILHANELSRRLKGAATTCYVALHPSMKGISGKYFVDCNELRPSSLATNEKLAKDLWEFSEKLINSAST
ncbi:hypothetical protein Cgig2_021060 [Carnegiea gigantea]|uniref:Short-chain dehydrogenase/reductase SDR n=1 Tax=Carnegiea gigantea TaxID=171969 RepID=A0A9Q1Q4F8_9CARY|nr:hypothetical protein Cgig2_021060 [Carnegiea gigantea]